MSFGAFVDLETASCFAIAAAFSNRRGSYGEIERLVNGIAPISGEIGNAISLGRSLSLRANLTDDYLVPIRLIHLYTSSSSHTPRVQEMKILMADVAIGIGITIFMYQRRLD